MPIQRETRDGATVVSLSGRVDAASAKELEEVLVEIVSVRHAVAVVDLSAVTGLSAAGLRPFLVAGKSARLVGGRIVLAGMPVSIKALFDSSGFSSLFETRPSVADALAARF